MLTSGYLLHLPEEENVILSGQAARRLIDAGDGDAALLYIAVLFSRGNTDGERLRTQLGWPWERFRKALELLAGQNLIAAPREAEPPPPAPATDQRPEYTRADMVRALEGAEFAALADAVEEKLGKKMTTPDMAILLGLYDQLGLPADVIFLLVSFCAERTAQRYGEGRRPTLRQIEKEGYTWARLGLMNQESAAAYIKKYHSDREALPLLMRLLRLGDRPPSPSEERYLLAWNDMGFDSDAVECAYDRTILKCKELKWPYMNKILTSWHQKGLHTLREIEAVDRPAAAPRRNGTQPPPSRDAGKNAKNAKNAKEDMARMEKYLQQLRGERGENREKEKEGG